MEKKLLNYVERGLKDGPIIVFLHGWPDTDKVFENQYPVFEKSHRLVTLLLPGYKDNERPFFGVSPAEILERAANTVKYLKEQNKNPDEKIYICGHDWGACFAYNLVMYHPTMFEKIVTLDIAMKIEMNILEKFLCLAYQLVSLILFFWPTYLGSIFTRLLAKILKCPHSEDVHNAMNYMYHHVWKNKILEAFGFGKPMFQHKYDTCDLPIPCLFIYGKGPRPLSFISKEWLSHLEATKGCKTLALTGAHWIMSDTPQNISLVNSALKDFIIE